MLELRRFRVNGSFVWMSLLDRLMMFLVIILSKLVVLVKLVFIKMWILISGLLILRLDFVRGRYFSGLISIDSLVVSVLC